MKFFKLLTFNLLLSFSFLMYGQEIAFQQIAGSPFATGSGPSSIDYSPLASGNVFAAIPNFLDGTVSVYQVNQTNGVLTQIAGSPFATGSMPDWQSFSPIASGNLFSGVTNTGDNTVSVYKVNQATGAFVEVPGSPFATGSAPRNVEFSPVVAGNLFAAVPNMNDNTVTVYRVNQTTGFFTPIPGSPFPTGSAPNFVSFSPVVNGHLFAGVVNIFGDSVTAYEVNQTTGAFTTVPGSPFFTDSAPTSVEFSPVVDGNVFALVTNSEVSTLSMFQVDTTTGTFTQIPDSPYPSGNGAVHSAFSLLPSGRLIAAVVNSNDDNFSVFEVDETNGSLTELPNSPVATGSGPVGIGFSIPLFGKVYTATSNTNVNTVSVFQVNDGTPLPPPLPPTNPNGFQKTCKFLTTMDYFNILTWNPSLTGADVVAYTIYRNNQLIGKISSQQQLQFIDNHVKKGKTYTYEIFAVNSLGLVSAPATITINVKK